MSGTAATLIAAWTHLEVAEQPLAAMSLALFGQVDVGAGMLQRRVEEQELRPRRLALGAGDVV